jgi:hypothetical protein
VGLQPLACWNLRVQFPLRGWLSVCCECCVLSGRSLCDGLIPRPEKFYRVLCVSVIPTPTQWGGPDPLGLSSHVKRTN